MRRRTVVGAVDATWMDRDSRHVHETFTQHQKETYPDLDLCSLVDKARVSLSSCQLCLVSFLFYLILQQRSSYQTHFLEMG